jgi:hypothetical protein
MDITEAIYFVLEKYLKKYPISIEGEPQTPRSLNWGYCYDFAEDVLKEMGLSYDGHTGHTEDYWTLDGNDLFSFKRLKLINKENPPKDLRISKELQIELGRATHAWIVYNNKYYDSETPEGVDRVLDLPIFKRITEYYKNKKLEHYKIKISLREKGLRIGYHGTFRQLDLNRFNKPIFFSSNINVAGVWAGYTYAYRYKPKGNIYKAWINFKNPLIVDAKGEGYSSIKTPLQMKKWTYLEEVDTDLIVEWAKKHRYDGVVIHNIFEGNGNTQMGNNYVVINPKTILKIEKTTFNKVF